MSDKKTDDKKLADLLPERKSELPRKWLEDIDLPENADEISVEASHSSPQTESRFVQKLEKYTRNLIYMSETDAEVLPFIGNREVESVDRDALLVTIQAKADASVEEREFDEFFSRLTTMQEWFDEERILMTRRYIKLKKLLEKHLKNPKVFKVGKIQIQIYVVGLDANNKLCGIKTEAVET